MEQFLEPVFAGNVVAAAEAKPQAALSTGELAVLSLVVALLGIGIAWLLCLRGWRPAEGLRRTFRPVYTLLAGRYFVDELYDVAIVRPGQAFAGFLAGSFDRGFLDGLVNGTGRFVDWGGGLLRRVESGYIRSYAAWMLLGALVLLIYWVVR